MIITQQPNYVRSVTFIYCPSLRFFNLLKRKCYLYCVKYQIHVALIAEITWCKCLEDVFLITYIFYSNQFRKGLFSPFIRLAYFVGSTAAPTHSVISVLASSFPLQKRRTRTLLPQMNTSCVTLPRVFFFCTPKCRRGNHSSMKCQRLD